MDILVFKTNIRYKKQLPVITPHLHSIPGVQRWNIDMHDRDKILRIQSVGVSPGTIEHAIRQAGYHCEELV
ncbi:MAG TPA: hypothetical protein VD993_13000 [Chitinophagaceae bacterium]|nr:hypothetical protein [Chitinophagaceae bacterium]